MVTGNYAMKDDDTRSVFSMQELEPSPVRDDDLEQGDYFQDALGPEKTGSGKGFFGQTLGLTGLRNGTWDSWLSGLQKYSTYPPTIFAALHFANTSLIPLATQSVADSESYLLLTREIYQAPGLEHLFLTVPVVTHVIAGLGLRNLRASRRARLYGAETRLQRYKVQLWPRMSLQARLGYVLVPLLGAHVLINRVTPLLVDGDSSGIGLGYIAHGFARSPLVSNLYYTAFVAAGVWHFVGGWASWMGWQVTTVRGEWRRRRNQSALEGHLNEKAWYEQRSQRNNRSKWIVYGLATAGTVFWLAGSLGIVGRGGPGAAWEAKNWDAVYNQVPLIAEWL